ncbi:MAG: restriction endonuclease subunit S [Flavobacteriaceae bacterium]|nr:restriction endonuclease subunit S [Flavobacteriaceae bacterium]
MVPEGWSKTNFGSITDIGNGQVDPREEPYSSMVHIGPENVLSGTGQLVNLKKCSELGLVSGKYEFDKGAVVYSKIRPNLNKVCRPKFSGVCSADMYPIWPKGELDIEFLFHYMLGPAFYKTAVSMSMRTGMPKINRSDLNTVTVLLPPVSEQKKIAQILSTWDKAITTTEKLLKNSQQQKKALMQQLLTGKKRLLDDNGVKFSGEWHKKELGELLDYKQPSPYLVKSTEYSDEHLTPVLTAGKSFILGYTNEPDGVFDTNLPVIIFDDFTTASQFVDFPFKVKSSAMKILVAKKGVSIHFVYEAMQRINFKVGGHKRHWISTFASLVINIPDQEEQKAISKVISKMTQELKLIEEKLERLKQEKKALMQQLLTGKRRVKLD